MMDMAILLPLELLKVLFFQVHGKVKWRLTSKLVVFEPAMIYKLVAICLQDITFESLKKSGIVVKPLSWGSPSEIDDRNDKIFQQTITLDIRTEWERRIPISNVL